MADEFSSHAATIDGPAKSAAAVTPSDGSDLSTATRGLYVGGAGAVVVDMVGTGSTITFAAVPAGTFLPVRAARVRSTGTTATNIVALW